MAKNNSVQLAMTNQLYGIVLLIVLIFVISFTIANSIYYSQLKLRPSAAISANAATAMMVINILVAIVCSLMMGWTAFRLFNAMEKKKEVYESVKEVIGA